MSELRRLIKSVNNYVVLTFWHPEIAKKNATSYLYDVEILKSIVDSYMDQTVEEFQEWCNKSVEVWDMSQSNIFLTAKRFLKMTIVNYHLDKLSGELHSIGILQNNLVIVKERLTQFNYLLTTH